MEHNGEWAEEFKYAGLPTAPARHLSALELVRRSGIPRSLLGATFSCHVMEYACGRCRGCVKHQETLARIDGGPARADTPAQASATTAG